MSSNGNLSKELSVVIAGGGIGGLFTGAFLARNGVKVTVLEKNMIIGGGLQCFRREGKLYETGMHVMGGFEEGGNLLKICRYLGIIDRLDIQHVDPECMDEIRYEKSGDVYRIPSGREAFIAKMSEYFPDESQGIKEYVGKLMELTEEMPLFYLREGVQPEPPHSEDFSMPADQLIARYVSDPKLREILAYLNPLYGGRAGHTPAYIHALINVLYLNGASRFVGGGQQLADALAGVIRSNGGEVIAGCEVSGFEVADQEIRGVVTADGRKFTADRYVSAIHPVEMLRLMPSGTFPKAYSSRLETIPNSCSAFSLYIDLKPGMFPYIGHTCYYMEDYGSMWNQEDYDGDDWPRSFMYMTPSEPNQGEYAGKLLVHSLMSFDRVRKWESTSVGHRGNDYEQWKEERAGRIISRLERIYPGIRGIIARVYSSSPLTVRDYYHTKEGAIFGYRKDSDNLIYSQLPVRTKVKNLLLTGQNVNLHGMCGVPLTAIYTAEAILGRGSLIKAINNAAD